MQYVSLSSTISDDPAHPTIFHVVGAINIETGDTLFDTATWNTKVADVDAAIAYSGQATGFLEDGVFKGAVETKYEFEFPKVPTLQIVQYGTGKIELFVER
jgi:hypothetical protein